MEENICVYCGRQCKSNYGKTQHERLYCLKNPKTKKYKKYSKERICERCGKTYTMYLSGSSERFCSKICSFKRRKNGWKCCHCGEVFSTRRKMTKHCIEYHKELSKGKYYRDHSIQDTPCPYCNRIFKNSSGLGLHKRYCSENPNKLIRKGHKTSEETKKKLSLALKNAYKNKSIWRTSIEKRKSYAEQYFDNIFPEAEQNYHVDRFFLDLAWVDKKCYLEVDGEQHYENNELRERDVKRGEILKNLGWTLICRVRWSLFSKLLIDEKIKIINQIKDTIISIEPKEIEVEYSVENNIKEITEFKKRRNDLWEIIQNSNIDFSKFGWVKKVSKLFGISENRAGEYIKRNYTDFYETCFKRNRS